MNRTQIRVLANYARMIVTVILGLLIVRFLIDASPDVFAVVTLIGTSVGVAGMFKEMVRGTMVPELSLSFHRDSEEKFGATFSSALVLSLMAAVLALAILGLFLIFLGTFRIGEGLLAAAGFFLITRMAVTFVVVLTSPATNLLAVKEHMVAHNFWFAMERVAEFTALVCVLAFIGTDDPAAILQSFGLLSMVLMIATTLGWAVHGLIRMPSARFSAGKVSRQLLRKLLTTIGWNGFVTVSMNLYFRLDVFIVNILFGVAGTVVFGVAMQIVNYSRQLTIGLVQGLDAVSARLVSTKGGDRDATRRLTQETSTLQALIIFGATAYIWVYTEAMFDVWLGDRLGTIEGAQTTAIWLTRIAMIGIAMRSLSEGWMKLLSGAGEVRLYAPILLLGAVFNPLLIAVFYFVLPDALKIYSVVLAFSLLLSIVHIVRLPKVTANFLGSQVRDVLSPFLRPALLAIVAGALMEAQRLFTDLSQVQNLLVGALIGGVILGLPAARALFRTGRDI